MQKSIKYTFLFDLNPKINMLIFSSNEYGIGLGANELTIILNVIDAKQCICAHHWDGSQLL